MSIAVALPSNYKEIAVSPDYKLALVLSSWATIKIYNLTSMSLLYVYTPPTTPTMIKITQKITFSGDSSLALI